MRNRNWKRVQPKSLTEAFRLCKDYAMYKRNLSAERIADLMGTSVDTLYKWIATGRMPSTMIRPFENACGCSYVTQYVCISGHKLMIDMPNAKPASASDINELQSCFTKAVGMLLEFYEGKADADPVLGELAATMAKLASHRAAVEMANAPELDLFAGEEA